MAAGIVVQAHRYDIVEGMSPLSPVWPSIPAIFLVYLPPLLICLVSLVYGGECLRLTRERHTDPHLTVIAMRFFVVHRMRFQALLKASHSGLNTSNYLRLMAIAGADLLMSLPLSISFLGFSIGPPPTMDVVVHHTQRLQPHRSDICVQPPVLLEPSRHINFVRCLGMA